MIIDGERLIDRRRLPIAVLLAALALTLALPVPAVACTADFCQMRRPDRAYRLAFIGRVET